MGKKTYLSYEQAREAVREKGWNSRAQYDANRKSVPGLPSLPSSVYSEWPGWAEFLGARDSFLPLEQALPLVRAHGFRSVADYAARYREVPGLPSNPDRVYGDLFPGWKTYLNADFNERQKRNNLPLGAAQALVQALGITSREEYAALARDPYHLPYHPTSDPDWPGWDTFLGRTPFTYEDARQAARFLGIRSARDYYARYKQHPDLPGTPQHVYRDSWTGWRDFLEGAPRKFRPYREAGWAASQAGIRNSRDYWARYKEVGGLPATPSVTYPEWSGWEDFLRGEDTPSAVRVLSDTAS